MDNESGRGHRSGEPPQLADVRRLHAEDVAGADAEWYETERLTGQLRGGTAADPPGPSAAMPVVLDWRHADAGPAPGALQRVSRRLSGRPGPRRDRRHRARAIAGRAGAGQPGLSGGDAPAVAVVVKARPLVSTAPQDGPVAEQPGVSVDGTPRLGLRDAADAPATPSQRRAVAGWLIRARRHQPALSSGMVFSVVAVSVVVMGCVAIASLMNGARSDHGRPVTASRPSAAVSVASRPGLGARGIVERQLRAPHRVRDHAHHVLVRAREPARAPARRVVVRRYRAPVLSPPRTVDVVDSAATPPTAPAATPSSAPVTGSGPSSAPVTGSGRPAAPTSTSPSPPATTQSSLRASVSAAGATESGPPAPGGPPAP